MCNSFANIYLQFAYALSHRKNVHGALFSCRTCYANLKVFIIKQTKGLRRPEATDELDAISNPTETDSLLTRTFSRTSLVQSQLLPPPAITSLGENTVCYVAEDLDLDLSLKQEVRMWFNGWEASIHIIGTIGVTFLCVLSIWLTITDLSL